MSCIQLQIQIQEPTGGLTETVFPKTERKLESESDYIEALQFVASKKNMSRYHSIMDFLFCETFPDPWRFKAFRYYNDIGPRIIDDPDVTIEELKSYDKILCNNVLEICLVSLKEKRYKSWSQMAKDLIKLLVKEGR